MKSRVITIIAAILITFSAAAQTQGRNASVVHLTTQEFKELVYNYEADPGDFKYNGTLPAIVDFYATWCRPCKALSPVLDELAKEYEGKIIIYKVDVDKEPELSNVFGISSIPTLLFIPLDEKPSITVGAPSKEQLRQVIEQLIK